MSIMRTDKDVFVTVFGSVRIALNIPQNSVRILVRNSNPVPAGYHMGKGKLGVSVDISPRPKYSTPTDTDCLTELETLGFQRLP